MVHALGLLLFAALAFLWFIGVVRDRIGDGEDGLFATVFLGSGLLFIVMLFATGAIAGGLVAGADAGLPPGDVSSLGRFRYTLLTVYAMRMAAVFAISTTTIATRLGLAPRWLTALGLTIGLVLLVSAGVIPWLELIFGYTPRTERSMREGGEADSCPAPRASVRSSSAPGHRSAERLIGAGRSGAVSGGRRSRAG